MKDAALASLGRQGAPGVHAHQRQAMQWLMCATSAQKHAGIAHALRSAILMAHVILGLCRKFRFD